MDTTEARNIFYTKLSEIYRLECICALLDWDQQVYMPQQGAQARSEQLEYMARALHEKMTDPKFADIIDKLNDERESFSIEDQVNIRETKRILDIQRKLPDDFVAEVAQIEAIGYSTWLKARPENDFKTVQPLLEKLIELAKKRCELVGYSEHPYDALLDIYEPGSKTSIVKPLLLSLAEELRLIIPLITERFKNLSELHGQYDKTIQHQLCKRVATDLGFSFEQGRIDTTAHPFMTTLGPLDHRITTSYDETNFISGLYSTIHETGHALYELGLPREYAGTPMGSAVSLSIHESQSRLWENLVGRSHEFSVYLGKVVKEFFPHEVNVQNPSDFWEHINRVEPSLIRTEADEVTYSQHVVIRMLLEEALIIGELSVADLPGAWNDLYEKYLGVKPKDYKNGVMQDVHWYSGSIGYFPTYALGNLYNSMMMESVKMDIPNLPQQIEKGDFTDLLMWLRNNVHSQGMRYRGPELIKNITGQDLSVEPFVNYLKNKFL